MDRARSILLAAAALQAASVATSCRRSESLLRSEDSRASKTASSATEPPAKPKPPVSFGYKGAWIAVKGVPKEKVASALGLTGPSDTTWEQGVRKSYDPDPNESGSRDDPFAFPRTAFVFVSPSVDGWTLAVGQRLAFFRSFAFKGMKEDRSPEKLLPFVETLSKKMGAPVQYFFSHRVPEVHIWVWAESGRIVRAYGYSGERGELLFNVGSLTEAETHMGLKLPTKSEDLDDEAKVPPDEQMVMDIAGKWSIDPTSLDQRKGVAPMGLIGILP